MARAPRTLESFPPVLQDFWLAFGNPEFSPQPIKCATRGKGIYQRQLLYTVRKLMLERRVLPERATFISMDVEEQPDSTALIVFREELGDQTDAGLLGQLAAQIPSTPQQVAPAPGSTAIPLEISQGDNVPASEAVLGQFFGENHA